MLSCRGWRPFDDNSPITRFVARDILLYGQTSCDYLSVKMRWRGVNDFTSIQLVFDCSPLGYDIGYHEAPSGY